MWPDQLSGPVDVCVAFPRLELDRPFTYLLDGEPEAGTGSLVSVPFHGRTLKGWILGPTSTAPQGRLLPVRTVRSRIRFFDPRLLELFRWLGERYLAPLATVIERSYPPRIASEERSAGLEGGHQGLAGRATAPTGPPVLPSGPAQDVLARYGGEAVLVRPGVSWLRPVPGDEATACVGAVRACLATGRRAIVLVPEAEPLPATARSVLDAFEGRAALFAGGEARIRYRNWLEIQAGRFDVVVGTRPAVFAPVQDVGLLWVSREVHPGHREERAPYYHVRDVAAARSRIEGAACVLASLSPSVETAVGIAAGEVREVRPPRTVERRAAPLVETTAPEAEDRSARLTALLKRARSAALIVSRRGYGIARVCRSCGQPATCHLCRGPIVVDRDGAHCAMCGARGACATCGGETFGLERGGTERIAEWAARIASVRIEVEAPGSIPAPGPDRIVVGTAAAVKDTEAPSLDLVAILDPDRALARPGLHAGERALATWMEAAAWAGPRGGSGRVLVHTRQPGHPAVQALVRWDPLPFLAAEGRHRAESGFPPEEPMFRVVGTPDLEPALRAAGVARIISTATPEGTVCLVAVSRDALPGLRTEILRLAERGVVLRVEAEPSL